MTIKLVTMTALAALLLSGAALAQGNGTPGAHFIENWDQDGDGAVSLEEVTEKRGDVFYMFDQDEDGMLNAEEYATFDETREADMAMENEEQGNGENGGGKQGGGHGGSEGMSLEFNDINDDGQVSQEEFTTSTAAWFATMDRNGDGEISTSDFGRK